jgi:glycine/D-amino acid oxidase-like deaminating enzyme
MADAVSDAVVIGAGVLGASTAFRLAEAGLRVTILEAERVGAGTSGMSFAWINSNGKPPRSYHDLNDAGRRAHFALREEFPSTPWLHEGGSLEIVPAAEAAAVEAKVARLREWDYAAELISPTQLRELEPELTLDALGADAAIAWFPDEGWIDPVLFAQAMVRRAQTNGAALHIGAKVTEVVVQGSRATGVKTADGRQFDAGLIVNCAGRWINEATPDAHLHIPLAPRVGVLVFTRPAPTLLARIVRTPLVDMRPDGAGRLMLHDNAIDGDFALDSPVGPTMPQAVRLAENVARLLPHLAGLTAEAVRITARPIPADGYSAVGPVPGVAGYYVAVTHSAVTMSAHLGKLIAREAMGETVAELAPFRPARFFSGNLAPGDVAPSAEATAFDRAN